MCLKRAILILASATSRMWFHLDHLRFYDSGLQRSVVLGVDSERNCFN
jgi:hypothetical protein